MILRISPAIGSNEAPASCEPAETANSVQLKQTSTSTDASPRLKRSPTAGEKEHKVGEGSGKLSGFRSNSDRDRAAFFETGTGPDMMG